YRISGGRVDSLTRAHSLGDELVRRGTLDPADPKAKQYRKVLLHCLGTDTLPDPFEVISFTPQPGDRLILTTDGVHDTVPPTEFPPVCLANPDPQRCAEQLVHLALDRGSRDNC